MVSDECQIKIPQSFMALYVDPGRHKPSAPRDVVASRYELCEDMASMLTESRRPTSNLHRRPGLFAAAFLV